MFCQRNRFKKRTHIYFPSENITILQRTLHNLKFTFPLLNYTCQCQRPACPNTFLIDSCHCDKSLRDNINNYKHASN